MREVKFLSIALVALLIATYLSWHRKDETSAFRAVTLLDQRPEQVRGLRLYTKTQTVTVSRAQASDGRKYAWFEIQGAGPKRSFPGSARVDELWSAFAPFEALRSLGALDSAGQKNAGFATEKRKLVVETENGDRVFELGGRTFGARDHYLRVPNQDEVVLVAARTLNDLEYPEARFMLRKVHEGDGKDVSRIVIKAGDKTRTFLQQNRLSPTEAFWSTEEKPGERNETVGNYLDKVDQLSAIGFGARETPLVPDQRVLEVTWYDGEQALDHLTLSRTQDRPAEYLAESKALVVPGKVARSLGEQLESDLPTLFAP